MKQRNIIGRILFYVGIFLLIFGIISSFINAYHVTYVDHYGAEEYVFEWRFFIQMLPTALFNGMIFIGLSEIVRLLDLIYVKQEKNSVQITESEEKSNVPLEQEDWQLDEQDKEKIYKLYVNQAILEITTSKVKGLCIIRLQDFNGPLDPVLKVVDVRGEEAIEINEEDRIKAALDGYNA